jgi:voltage-gated potassium channel Kch
MLMTNHYIVCGLGRVGRSAAFELQRAGVLFVVIDRDEQRVEQATEAGMAAMRFPGRSRVDVGSREGAIHRIGHSGDSSPQPCLDNQLRLREFIPGIGLEGVYKQPHGRP